MYECYCPCLLLRSCVLALHSFIALLVLKAVYQTWQVKTGVDNLGNLNKCIIAPLNSVNVRVTSARCSVTIDTEIFTLGFNEKEKKSFCENFIVKPSFFHFLWVSHVLHTVTQNTYCISNYYTAWVLKHSYNCTLNAPAHHIWGHNTWWHLMMMMMMMMMMVTRHWQRYNFKHTHTHIFNTHTTHIENMHNTHK